MPRISWTEKKTNQEVFDLVKEKRTLLWTTKYRSGKMLSHVDIMKTIIERKIQGKRARG